MAKKVIAYPLKQSWLNTLINTSLSYTIKNDFIAKGIPANNIFLEILNLIFGKQPKFLGDKAMI